MIEHLLSLFSRPGQPLSHGDRLEALRSVLRSEKIDAFLVPRADEYQGEYVPASADRLRWISGFTGSAGIAIVARDCAAVLSDGRYTIQLKQQLDPSLFETGDSTKLSAADWLLSRIGAGAVVGYDPRLHTAREVKTFVDKGLVMKPLAENAVDRIWADRPDPPGSKVQIFPLSFAGSDAQEKLDRMGSALQKAGMDTAVLSLPDSIAWLLNIRGEDIPHIPVALSYALAHADGTLDWFIDRGRVEQDVAASFGNRVSLHDPAYLPQAIESLKGRKVLVDGRRSSIWFTERLEKAGAHVSDQKDPVIAMKARKNGAEKQAMRNAHIRDGVAVTLFLKWLSEQEGEGLSELDVERKLEEFRRRAPEYRDSSFDTIAGYGPNGAIVHYRATQETSLRLQPGNLLLLDSGAQYSDGTTDITRTVAIGQPTEEMMRHYTLVLKGHIAVSMARFPAGTTGAQVDTFARAPLWQNGLDYAHGTGHGVGCYLSVHEEAASLSPRGADAIEEGMILSNEPGYYQEGAYGIRIENLILAHEAGVCESTGKTMLAFETLTFAPYDQRLIVKGMLTRDETRWLDDYHALLIEKVGSLLGPAEKAWLESQWKA